jgi:hypothetical protein
LLSAICPVHRKSGQARLFGINPIIAAAGYSSPNGKGLPENTHQETAPSVAPVITSIFRAPTGNGLSNFSGARKPRSIEKSQVHQKTTRTRDATTSRKALTKHAGQRRTSATPSSAENRFLPCFAIITAKSSQYGTAKVSATIKKSFSYMAPADISISAAISSWLDAVPGDCGSVA